MQKVQIFVQQKHEKVPDTLLLFMNYFQVENYVNYGNPNGLAVIRKSDSDKALNKNNSSEGGGGKGSTPKKGSSKKNKRKNFKRSLTMTALPLAFFKGEFVIRKRVDYQWLLKFETYFIL